jgi:excisionase family DNA binding protein
MENIVTAKELAGCLKLTEATIYKLASRGELPGFKIGDSWRFDMDEVMQLFQKIETQKGKNRSPAL